MVSSNQRSINQGIQKVVGSSNRGFLSLDPERQQPRIVTQPPKAVPAAGVPGEFRSPQARPATAAPGPGTPRR